MRMIRLGTAAFLALALLPSSAHAAEPYEGAWVATLKDCGDHDGPTSLAVIDLEVNVDGRKMPMVDRYEYHCRIDRKATVATDTTLFVTCFEFWDDLRKNINGRKETIKLSVVSKDLLKISDRQYRRCPAANKAGKDAQKR